MKERQRRQNDETQGATWESTQYSNIVRHGPSGRYYARFRVKGKLIWRALKTDKITVAKLKLDDITKKEREQAEAGHLDTKTKILFRDALAAYRSNGFRPVTPRNRKDAQALKPLAVSYYEQRAKALLESWPELDAMNVRHVTERQCQQWAATARQKSAATVFNHTLGFLRNCFDFAIKAGARYDNPAKGIMRESETPKRVELPSADEFERFIKAIESSGSGWSKRCADLVRFMAFGGFRKGEAMHVTWADCDFEKGQITLRGDPETGLKNRQAGEVRTVPMIEDMRQLLIRLRDERSHAKPADSVMLINECQRSMDRAAKEVGMKRITHHDLRHLFATRCIESGVDIPTVARWLGHKDGGALAMRVYGHLRDHHSTQMAQRVSFGIRRISSLN